MPNKVKGTSLSLFGRIGFKGKTAMRLMKYSQKGKSKTRVKGIKK